MKRPSAVERRSNTEHLAKKQRRRRDPNPKLAFEVVDDASRDGLKKPGKSIAPTSIDEWGWSEVVPSEMLEDMGGFLSLEEIDGVEVVEADGGAFSFRPAAPGTPTHSSLKHKKENAKSSSKRKRASPYEPLPEDMTARFIPVDDFVEDIGVAAVPKEEEEVDSDGIGSIEDKEDMPNRSDGLFVPKVYGDVNVEPDAAGADMSAWSSFSLPSPILASLQSLGFTSPTPIQSAVLPHALSGRDIIGAAETGSGKTLAFSLPILTRIFQHRVKALSAVPTASKPPTRPPSALVLSPTRELATQIADHIRSAGSHLAVRVASIIGGMSVQKQRRMLSKGPDIVVATVGRLWEVMEDDPELTATLKSVGFLVLDEGDRMVQAGHFKELDLILRGLNSKTDMSGNPDRRESKRQTFVFSATMNGELAPKKKQGKGNWAAVVERIGFQDPMGPVRVDLTHKNYVSSSLSEGRIESSHLTDHIEPLQDAFLLYLLLRHPSRTLVFFPSLPSLKRVSSLLRHILTSLPTPRPLITLHGHMQQRERLKHVEKFANEKGAVMVATDVAARGLDVTGVEMVVQYGVPKEAEVNILTNFWTFARISQV
ncbi:ATP-dependent RNA helicase [Gonapodya sp. JEL0774]|nr:ATP-dependent RNA helicase [Gonapodya sp. JEL0774]